MFDHVHDQNINKTQILTKHLIVIVATIYFSWKCRYHTVYQTVKGVQDPKLSVSLMYKGTKQECLNNREYQHCMHLEFKCSR
jgi:hypothetical protein